MNKEELKRRKDMLLDLMSDPIYMPMKIKELAIFLDIPLKSRHDLSRILEELVYEGQIRLSPNGRYSKINVINYVGIYNANQRGFGFVKVDGLDKDIFIPSGDEKDALHGDTVKIEVDVNSSKLPSESSGHIEARVSEVIQHANKEIVGIYKKNKSFGFVIPDNQKILRDIFIPKGCDKNAKSGDKVVAKIYDYGSKHKKPEAKITEVLGNVHNPGVDILSIVKSYALPEQFDEYLLEEAQKVSSQDISAEYKNRLDLRELRTVTIDSEDAKDLDDAISLDYDGELWHLGVHIADVAHYIKEKSPLDKEALDRGTSIYLVDRVIPMFPESISNGCCSLNAKEDKLSLSCIMDIDNQGKLVSHRITESIINVDLRMSYKAVAEILETKDITNYPEYADYMDLIQDMHKLQKILHKKRADRGSIDFDIPESRIELDKYGKVVNIAAYDRNEASKIIEEFMLMANETVAEEYFWLDLPFVYRIHDKPDPEKMKELAIFINNFGFSIKQSNGEIHPKEIQKLLDKIKNSQAEALISRIALRSMKQAKYSSENSIHFGLAAKYYTHFTSPIRRYPDLQIHRIIKEHITKGIITKRREHYTKILDNVCSHASAMERRAEEAERETYKYKKCEYMLEHLGERFSGVISGVTSFGIYVELDNSIEGLVRLAGLNDDYYNYIEQEYSVVGEKTGKTYKLGQKVDIYVDAVDKMSKTIDFVMC